MRGSASSRELASSHRLRQPQQHRPGRGRLDDPDVAPRAGAQRSGVGVRRRSGAVRGEGIRLEKDSGLEVRLDTSRKFQLLYRRRLVSRCKAGQVVEIVGELPAGTRSSNGSPATCSTLALPRSVVGTSARVSSVPRPGRRRSGRPASERRASWRHVPPGRHPSYRARPGRSPRERRDRERVGNVAAEKWPSQRRDAAGIPPSGTRRPASSSAMWESPSLSQVSSDTSRPAPARAG